MLNVQRQTSSFKLSHLKSCFRLRCIQCHVSCTEDKTTVDDNFGPSQPGAGQEVNACRIEEVFPFVATVFQVRRWGGQVHVRQDRALVLVLLGAGEKCLMNGFAINTFNTIETNAKA